MCIADSPLEDPEYRPMKFDENDDTYGDDGDLERRRKEPEGDDKRRRTGGWMNRTRGDHSPHSQDNREYAAQCEPQPIDRHGWRRRGQ